MDIRLIEQEPTPERGIHVMTDKGWVNIAPVTPGSQPSSRDAAFNARLARVTEAFGSIFIRKDGKDMREQPLVQHPATGNLHYNHLFWPLDE